MRKCSSLFSMFFREVNIMKDTICFILESFFPPAVKVDNTPLKILPETLMSCRYRLLTLFFIESRTDYLLRDVGTYSI